MRWEKAVAGYMVRLLLKGRMATSQGRWDKHRGVGAEAKTVDVEAEASRVVAHCSVSMKATSAGTK